MIAMAMTLAPSLSPAIGAYLAEWVGWRANFVLLGGFGTAVLILAAATLQETRPDAAPLSPGGITRSLGALLRSPAFLGYALATAFTSASWFTFLAIAPYFLSDLLHQPPSTYGLMILLPMAGYFIGNAGAVRFAVRLGSTRLFVVGLAVSLASGILLARWSLGAELTAWALVCADGVEFGR